MRHDVPANRAEARPEVASPETSPDASPAATAAAGHCEGGLVEPSLEPRSNDLVPLAGDERDDPDAEGSDHLAHRPRDRTTDERVDAEVGEASRRPTRRPRGKQLFRSRDHSPGLGLHHVEIPGRVEDGCDTSVPEGEGRFRSFGGSVSVHAVDAANPGPAQDLDPNRLRNYVWRTGCAIRRERSLTLWSSATATLFGGYGSTRATPRRPEPTARPAEGARCRACGSAGRASSCGCRAPSQLRAG